MKIGFNAPMAGALSAPEHLMPLLLGGESLGFDFASFSDHVVIPTDIHSRYPYSATGEIASGTRGDHYDQLTAIAFLAAKTTTLRLVTSVMVVPHRPAVLTAKILSTIDVLSGGRLTLGIGAGWLKEEFEAIDAPDFAARGKVTDEYLDAILELWTSENPRFDGEHVRFHDIVFLPKPLQTPHPPIWVGGESAPALRRTARIGDAWYPIDCNPANPLDSLPRYTANVTRLRELVEKAGRDPEDVKLAYRSLGHGDDLPATAGDGERRLFSGAPDAIAADIRAFEEMGVDSLDFGFPGDSVEAILQRMENFQSAVLSRV